MPRDLNAAQVHQYRAESSHPFQTCPAASLLKVGAPLPAFPEMRSPPDAAHIPDALSPARSDTHSCLTVFAADLHNYS